MFRNGHFRKKERINFLLNDGGLGDHIARMSAIKYIRETFKNVDVHLFCPDYFVELASHLVPKISVHKYSNLQAEWGIGGVSYRQTKNHHDTLKTHLVDHAFHILCNKQMMENKHKNYCKLDVTKIDTTKFSLPENYVVVTTGYTAAVREMLPEVVNTISKYLVSKNITPVFLGSRQASTGDPKEKLLIGNFKADVDYCLGLDLIDQTNLLEAGKIIAGSKSIIGLDNGLLHLAGCSDVPIIGGFTTVEPIYRMPYRNDELGWNYYPVVPEKSLKCRFCQSNWEFVQGHDFRKCYYVENKTDTEIKCVKALTADKYITALDKILENTNE